MSKKNTNRDNFPAKVIKTIRDRVEGICSNPDCRRLTIGPHSDKEKFLNLGRASHITAAAPGGPRYDPNITRDERRSIDNAIWLCNMCADKIDKDEEKYTQKLLLSWKKKSESIATKQLEKPISGHNEILQTMLISKRHSLHDFEKSYSIFAEAYVDKLSSIDPRFNPKVDFIDNITHIRLGAVLDTISCLGFFHEEKSSQ